MALIDYENYFEVYKPILKKILLGTTKKKSSYSSLIDEYKKGSKIHIKKENRGKFTLYCGGTVTLECIDRAKRSSSPTLRKRATFAENSRHWKHK